MRIAKISRSVLPLAALLALAGVAVPANAASTFYACMGSVSMTINPQAGGCPAGSTLVQMQSYSLEVPPGSSGNPGQNWPGRSAATKVIMTIAGKYAAEVSRLVPTSSHLKGVAIAVYNDPGTPPGMNMVLADVFITGWRLSGRSASLVGTLLLEAKKVTIAYHGLGARAASPR
jgi:hypothetical protein